MEAYFQQTESQSLDRLDLTLEGYLGMFLLGPMRMQPSMRMKFHAGRQEHIRVGYGLPGAAIIACHHEPPLTSCMSTAHEYMIRRRSDSVELRGFAPYCLRRSRN